MGTSFAHVLEMRAKLAMPAALWLKMQHGVYAEFATIGAVVELGSIVLTGLLAFLVRNDRRLFLYTAMATALIAVGFFGVWLIATNPVNAKTAVWTPSSIPEDWADWRSQWKYSHLLRFVLHLIALSLLVLAILPRRARGPYV